MARRRSQRPPPERSLSDLSGFEGIVVCGGYLKVLWWIVEGIAYCGLKVLNVVSAISGITFNC